MYKTVSISGSQTLYQGEAQVLAILKAQDSGSDAIVYSPDGGSMIYSPISGWRQL